MPYRGANDPTLPTNVKGLPADKRAQWVAVFNQSFADCDGPADECEGAAFRKANGTVKEAEATGDVQPSGDKAEGVLAEKMDYEPQHHSGPAPIPVSEVPGPYGGATTFSELEAFEEAHEQACEVEKRTDQFRCLVDNILRDDELTSTERAQALETAASDLHMRLMAEGERSVDEEDKPGLFDRIKALTQRRGGENLPVAAFADVGDPTKPSTWSLPLWESGSPSAERIAMAITALQPGGFRGNPVKLESGRSAVIGKIRGAIGRLGDADAKKRLTERLGAVKDSTEGGVTVFKDSAGDWRWLAVYSNRFWDKEEEMFADDAHKDYVEWVDKTGNYPELWAWHTPGTKTGVADMVGYTDTGFALATGPVTAGAEVAQRLAESKDLGVSHGYVYAPQDLRGGVYRKYRTFEISYLPMEKAANDGTAFIMEAPVLNDEKMAFLREKLGDEKAEQVVANIDAMAKDFSDKGVGFKDVVAAIDERDNGNGDDEEEAEVEEGGEGGESGEADTTASEAGGVAVAEAGDEKAATGAAAEAVAAAVKDAIAGPLEDLAKVIKSQNARLAQLEKSDDEKIAETIKPRAGVRSATESEDNVVDNDAVKGLVERNNGGSSPVDGALEDLQSMLGTR